MKKRKTILWILGWLLLFPVPLTILILRNQKMNKSIKYILVAIAWLLFISVPASGNARKTDDLKRDAIEVVLVERIDVSIEKSELILGENTLCQAIIIPSDAENGSLVWNSSDETVVKIDDQGNVQAVGGGVATITVQSTDGPSSSLDVTVDGTKALMKINVSRVRVDDVNIGDEWNYDDSVNGEKAFGEMLVSLNETVSLHSKYSESDAKPDVGSADVKRTINEEDINNGFEVSLDLYVTENGGKNTGKTAHFVVTYTFRPIYK